MKTQFSRSLRLAVCTTLGAAAGLTSFAAFAQQSSGGGAAQLEDIVVTARKTEESLQEAPVAVAAFTAEQIQDRQMQSVDDVARYAPGLVFDKAFGRTTDRPVIRGQGNVLAGVQAGVEAGAAYFVDGIYYPGDIQSFDFNEVERVEVIRGPQSALYGRNTYSGAINYVTRSPSDYFRVSGRGSFDKDETQASMRLEGPLSETIAASLSLRYQDFGGQWVNQVTQAEIGQEKTQQAAAVLEWKPSEDYRLKLRASYTKDRDGTRPFWFQASDGNNCFPGYRSLNSYELSGSTNNFQYYCGELKIRPIYVNDGPAYSGILPRDPAVPANLLTLTPASQTYNPDTGIAFSGVERNSRYFSAISDWDIAGSGYTLTVDGGLRVEARRTGSDSDFMSYNNMSPAARLTGAESTGANTSADDYNDYSVEVRLASPSDRDLRFLVGAYYYEQEQRLSDINFYAPKGMYAPFQISDVYNKAVFGLVEWKFAPDWSIAAEGRQATETKQFQEWATTVNGIGATTFYGKQDWKKFTPRVTLKWQATPDLNLYAIYADGVKPGGFNGAAGRTVNPTRETYEQETSKNYEIGAKTTWLDGALTANVALFYIDAKNIQLTQAITSAASPNAVTSLVTNQGAGDIQGVEVETRWRASEYLTFGLNYSMADSAFKQGCDDFQYTLTSGGGRYLPVASGGSQSFDGCAGSNAATNFTGQGNPSIKGKRFPLSAKHTASVTADWLSPLGGTGLDFYANVGASYTGKRFVQVHNLAYVGAATVVDARFGIQKEDWNIGVYAKNLTNEDSPTVATRWFTSPYVANTTRQTVPPNGIPIPGLTPIKAGLPSNTFASYSLPRAFFGGFRRERQVGIEAAFRFGAPPAATPVATAAPLAAAPAPAPAPAPVVAPPAETAGDGVIDPNDKCPGTPAGAKVDANGCEIEEVVLQRVNFEFDSAKLTADSRQTLDALVATLRQRSSTKVEIRGHTDSRGSDTYNQKLSERRAASVADYLVENGIDRSRVSSVGLGESQPIAGNDTDAGRAQNRRVAVQFTDIARK
jgi:outer membrane receptor protein involved in Fe transport/outer membrane protein OmpA-like peptidoglycan-associated protein